MPSEIITLQLGQCGNQSKSDVKENDSQMIVDYDIFGEDIERAKTWNE